MGFCILFYCPCRGKEADRLNLTIHPFANVVSNLIIYQSRFIEMFGNPLTNDKNFKTKKGKNIFKISNGKTISSDKRLEKGIPAYGGNGISWYTNDILFEEDTLVIGRVGFQSGNVRLVRGPLWITDNAMYISKYNKEEYNLIFLHALMEYINFSRYQDAGDLKKITQKPFMEMIYILPPRSIQEKFADWKKTIDKSK